MIFDNENNHRDENSFVNLIINRKKIISIVKRMKDELKVSDLTDYELWEAFRKELHDYILQHFEQINRVDLRDFRIMFRSRDVYVSQKQNLSVIRTLLLMLKEKEKALWFHNELLEMYRTETFIFKKLIDYVNQLKKRNYSYDIPETSFRGGRRRSIIMSISQTSETDFRNQRYQQY